MRKKPKIVPILAFAKFYAYVAPKSIKRQQLEIALKRHQEGVPADFLVLESVFFVVKYF